MSFSLERSSPREGEVGYKNLKDYSNEELIWFLENNTRTCLSMMSGITSEILRRMNKEYPILPK